MASYIVKVVDCRSATKRSSDEPSAMAVPPSMIRVINPRSIPPVVQCPSPPLGVASLVRQQESMDDDDDLVMNEETEMVIITPEVTEEEEINEDFHFETVENDVEIERVERTDFRYVSLDRILSESTVSEYFMCVECNLSFSSKSSLDQHIKNHAEKNIFLCAICQQEYASEGTLTAHLRRAHAEVFSVRKTASDCKTCDECDEEFSSVVELSEHKRICGGSGEGDKKRVGLRRRMKACSKKGGELAESKSTAKTKAKTLKSGARTMKKLAKSNAKASKKVAEVNAEVTDERLGAESAAVSNDDGTAEEVGENQNANDVPQMWNDDVCQSVSDPPNQSTGDQSTGDQSTGDQSTGDQSTGDQSTGDQAMGDQLEEPMEDEPDLSSNDDHDNDDPEDEDFEALEEGSSTIAASTTTEKRRGAKRKRSKVDDKPTPVRRSSYTCSACGHTESLAKMMDRHYKLHHPGQPLWQCDKCESSFTRYRQLSDHRIYRHATPVRRELNSYECALCTYVTNNKRVMDLHIREAHDSAKLWKCDDCDKSFASSKSLLQHRLSWHNTENDEREFVCETCGAVFGSAQKLHRHRANHGNGPVTCSICQRTFSNKYNLHTHLKRIHDQLPEGVIRSSKSMKDARSPPCPVCGRTYVNEYVLKQHMAEHEGKRKTFACECGKKFFCKTQLKYHQEIHQDLEFTCEACDKIFPTTISLRSHMKQHQEKRHLCGCCGKKFRSSGHLRAHLRTHTGEKPFQCKHCDKSFAQQATLQNHERTHTGEKPYRCNHCNRTFHRPCQLEGHIQLQHDGSNSFACIVCCKVFKSVRKLREHLLETHSEELSSGSESSAE